MFLSIALKIDSLPEWFLDLFFWEVSYLLFLFVRWSMWYKELTLESFIFSYFNFIYTFCKKPLPTTTTLHWYISGFFIIYYSLQFFILLKEHYGINRVCCTDVAFFICIYGLFFLYKAYLIELPFLYKKYVNFYEGLDYISYISQVLFKDIVKIQNLDLYMNKVYDITWRFSE